MKSLVDDLRYGARLLAKRPLWTVTAVLALALGISFNTTMFSVADALCFRPLVVPEVDRVTIVEGQAIGNPRSHRRLSPADVRDIREQATSFSILSADRAWEATVTGYGDPQRVSAQRVTGDFFEIVQKTPVAGRFFGRAEETEGRHQVAVLAYNFWEQRFGADRAAVGATIRINDEPFTVIGVMPKEFRYPLPVEMWVPLMMSAQEREESGNFTLRLMGRLKPGVTMEQARTEIGAIAGRARQKYPQSHDQLTFRVESLTDIVSGDLTRAYTGVMLGAAVFLLLICCANVANLQFVRMTARTREMAVRSSLGATAKRLFGQIVAENLVLAAVGGLASLAITYWCVDLVKSSMPAAVEQFLPGWHRMSVDGRGLLYTMLVTMAAAMVTALIPGWFLSRTPIGENLKETSRSTTAGRARQRFRFALLATQVAIAMVLLAGASLMIRSFRAVLSLWPNAGAEEVLTFRLALPASRYATDAAVEQFQRRALERFRALPGVESAAMVYALPLSQKSRVSPVTREGLDAQPGPRRVAVIEAASDDYFRTLRIPIVQGRGFASSDTPSAPLAGLVSENMAQQSWPGENPIGKRIALGPADPPAWITIVGVVATVSYDYTEHIPAPVVYVSATQQPERAMDYALRLAGDAAKLGPEVLRTVQEMDASLPVFEMNTLERLTENSLTGIGYVAKMMAVLGLTALFLALLGIYAVISHIVDERTPEIGVRLALGAARRDILWMVFRQGAWVSAIGLAAGFPLAWGMARMLSGLVFGVSPTDWTAFVLVPVLLTTAALTASYLPARRATGTDPIRALRYE